MESFYDEGSIIRIGIPPVRIEMINIISGVSFDEVWNNKKPDKYGDIDIYYIGFEQLIKNKKASGRPKDLVDINELQSD